MTLDKILSISGKSGLYKIITQMRNGAIVESLTDKKRLTVGVHSNVSILSEIAIYTLVKEVPLQDVFLKIKIKENAKPTSISHKDGKDVLEEYFFEVLPDYDEDKVYASDIKKIIQWYNTLHANNLLNIFKDQSEDATSEEEE